MTNWYKFTQNIKNINNKGTHSKWRYILMADVSVPIKLSTNNTYIGSRDKNLEKSEAFTALKNIIDRINRGISNKDIRMTFSIQSEGVEK